MEDIRHAPSLKFQRAKSLFSDLNDVVKAFVESEFYSIGLEADPDTGKKLARISIEPLPENIPLIIGDIIHNSRSALDILWATMVRNLGASDTHCHFPFDTEREALERRVLRDEKIIVPKIPEIGRIIVEDIKPYKAGNLPLWTMNKLNVMDKHRLLLTSANITKISLSLIDEGHNMTHDPGAVFESGVVDMSGVFSDNVEKVSYGKPSVAIVFDIPIVKGLPVFPVLNAMGSQTEKAIDLIGNAWDGANL